MYVHVDPSPEHKPFVAFLVTAIRLQVLKNGERDRSKAVHVVGPDISNVTRPITENSFDALPLFA